jgi:hypothetical protein
LLDLKNLIPGDDSCKLCEFVYDEFISLWDMHASTLKQLKAEKDKNDKHVCVIVKPNFCDKC